MHYSALFYRLKKGKAIDTRPNADETNRSTPKTYSTLKCYSTKYTTQQVFTVEQETMLRDYILKCSVMNYGLTYRQVRQLAYQYAKRLGSNIPVSWDAEKTAGIDWLKGYMKRQPQLTLRKPENTSLARATAFNKVNVKEFFDNYERAVKAGAFTAENIYNLDETGISTVLQAPNVVAKLGARQVGQTVSGERGSMITMCMTINAVGNTVPPVFIFPRAKFHDSLLFGAPPGSLGLANNPKSGWMTGPLFLEVLKHVQKHTRCSKENKILLVMDNHESHCTLNSVMYARDNGIVLVTFPPHCSHKLQPLDVGVLGPFKSKLKVAQNDWLTSNPGKTIKIHNLAEIANTAYTASFTNKNITAAFEKTGVWPLNRLVFTDDDFVASSVIQTITPPLPENSTSGNLPSTSTDTVDSITENLPDTSKDDHITIVYRLTPKKVTEGEGQASGPKGVITPEEVRPYPKGEAQMKKGGRPKGKSKVLTETPEKNRIEEETRNRLEKKRKLASKVVKFKPKSKSTKKLSLPDSSDSECLDEISLHDESDCENLAQLLAHTTSEIEELIDLEMSEEIVLQVNDFVLVEFAGKKTKVMFVGQIEALEEEGMSYKVKFMRKKDDSWKFYFPEKDDISSIEKSDIKLKLPQPSISGGTARAVSAMTFPINFTSIKEKNHVGPKPEEAKTPILHKNSKNTLVNSFNYLTYVGISKMLK